MTNEHRPLISFTFKLLAGIMLFIGMFFMAMVTGAADIAVKDVWQALTPQATGEHVSIIREIRLPREVAAVFVGAALAVAGAVMQGMTRNPLADPGLFGLTAGATLALAVTHAFIPGIGHVGIMIACLIGATVGALLVFGIGTMKKGGFSPLRLVLAGAAISTFLFAIAEGISIYFKISKDVSMWTAGGLIGTSWTQLQMLIPLISIGILVALVLSRQLTILSLNDEVAIGLGQRTTQIKALLFLIIVLLSGASVALVGNIAFLGLMVPHIVRAIVGKDYRYILPLTIFVGATFMLLADTLGRTIHAPYETPVAAIIAMIGLPFFLFIVHKGGRSFS
jgi:iron complex transport system permease protein